MKRESLEKTLQYIENQNISITDIRIHQCIESIELNMCDSKPNVTDFIKENYNDIHQLVKDVYLKDSSNIDLWNLTVFSLYGVMLETHMKEHGVNYSVTKWDVITPAEFEFADFMEGLNRFKTFLSDKESDAHIISLIAQFMN